MIRTAAEYDRAMGRIAGFALAALSVKFTADAHLMTSELMDDCAIYIFAKERGVVEAPIDEPEPNSSNVVSIYPAIAARDGYGSKIHV